MAQFVATKVGKILSERALEELKVKNFDINGQNPYEEEVAVLDRDGRPTRKTKKRKRPIPNTLSPNDARVLKRVRSRAYHLDMSLFHCCGIRFGWSSVVAIIPVIGDFIDVFMALMVVRMCHKVDGGLPQTLRARMIFNILIDFGIGLVPIIGDIADAIFRANTRNAWLLETYLVKKVEAERSGGVRDPESGKTLPANPRAAIGYGGNGGDGQGGGTVARPSQAAVAENLARTGPGNNDLGSNRGASGGGGSGGGRFARFFGGGGGRTSDFPDEEMSVGVTNNGPNRLQQSGR